MPGNRNSEKGQLTKSTNNCVVVSISTTSAGKDGNYEAVDWRHQVDAVWVDAKSGLASWYGNCHCGASTWCRVSTHKCPCVAASRQQTTGRLRAETLGGK